MRHYAVYARFSSNLQDNRSIRDQLDLCRRKVLEWGGAVVEVYTDEEISGASLSNRPGIRRLLIDVRSRRFAAVATEALDRLSRDQSDAAWLFKYFHFYDVSLMTVEDGEVNEIHIGLKGTMNALFLKNLRNKVRRGQIGRVREGLTAAGKAYGYDIRHETGPHGRIKRGGRVINPAEAAIVNRIFKEYRGGKSVRDIAVALNAAAIPGPRGGQWRRSTIAGDKVRGTGILNNRIYIGKLIYNRTSWFRDPETGKRQVRVNPKSEWIVTDVPALRIIPLDLFEQVQKKRGRNSSSKSKSPGLKYPLTGIVFCAACGAKAHRRGWGYYRCGRFDEQGICENNLGVSEKQIADKICEAVSAYLTRDDNFVQRAVSMLERRGEQIEEVNLQRRLLHAEEHRIVMDIEDGADIEPLAAGMSEVQYKKSLLRLQEDRLTKLPADDFDGLRAALTAKFGRLRTALKVEDDKTTVLTALRSLAARVEIRPVQDKGKRVAVRVTPSFDGLMTFAVERDG